MTFKTLLERYEKNIESVYAQPRSAMPQLGSLEERFDEAQDRLYDPSRVHFKPGDIEYRWVELKRGQVGTDTALLKAQGRSLPITATAQDLERLTKFHASGRGLLFLAQQALMQTGNTFATTRAINPLFAIANATPFLHLSRHIGTSLSILGVSLDVGSSKNIRGKLQRETVETLGPSLTQQVTESSAKSSAKRLVTGLLRDGIDGIVKSLLSPIKSIANIITGVAGNDEEYGLISLYMKNDFPIFYEAGNPFGKNQGLDVLYTFPLKLNPGLPDTTGYDGMYYKGGIRTVIRPSVSSTAKDAPSYVPEHLGMEGTQDVLSYKAIINGAPVPYITRTTADKSQSWQVAPALNSSDTTPNRRLNDVYDVLSNEDDAHDYVITRIRVGDFNMQFRSFISNLKESVTSQMNEKTYIGRPERFVTYEIAKRTVAFSLTLIAMHPDELMATHARLNYLIGALFPVNAIQGLMQPPIAFLTIGDLFKNQPGYFQSLNIDYPFGWEVRSSGAPTTDARELPMGATVDVTFNVLEKGTMFHQSPFHSIMERY